MKRFVVLQLGLVISCLNASAAIGQQETVSQETVPHWSSFQNAGTLVIDAAMPTEWSPEKGIAWQVKLAGYGQSTAVTFGDQVYVTSVSGAQKEDLHVQAFALDSGEQVWEHSAKNSTPEENTAYVSRAAPTPVCDDLGLIAFFEGGNVIALTHEGEVRWEIDLVKEHGDVKARHSLAASLEQNQNHVFIWVEREAAPYVLAVSKATGETVWRSEGVGKTSWASPRLVPVDGGQHLVLNASGKIVGLDPETGDRLWEFTEVGGNSTPTPVIVSEGRFLMGASPGRGEAESASTGKSNGVVQVVKEGDTFKASWHWQAERATSSFGSPVTCQGKAWFVNRQGVVFCHDVESGEEVFAKRGSCGSVWATPLAIGDQLYLFGKDGMTSVLNAGANQLEEIATNQLWSKDASADKPAAEGESDMGGPVLYAATVTSRGLILRRGDVLYCVGK